MKLVITENITLDGVVEAGGDWFSTAGDESEMLDIQAKLQNMMEREDALLLGRVTFEEFRGYWPCKPTIQPELPTISIEFKSTLSRERCRIPCGKTLLCYLTRRWTKCGL